MIQFAEQVAEELAEKLAEGLAEGLAVGLVLVDFLDLAAVLEVGGSRCFV